MRTDDPVYNLIGSHIEPLLERIQTLEDKVKRLEVPDRWVTREAAAKHLSVHPSSIDRYVKAGKLTKLLIGGSVRYDRHEIDQFLEAQRARVHPKTGAKWN